MKSNVLAALVLALAACGGTTTSSNTTTATSGTHAASTAANGSGNNGSATNGSGNASTSTSTTGATAGANSTGAGSNGSNSTTTGANSTGASSTTGTNGSDTGNCVPDGSYASNATMCCSGAVDTNGYCTSASTLGAAAGATGANSTGTTSNGTTGNGATTNGSGTTGASATGTTTGGTCPNNMPNLVTGQGGRGVGACNTNPGSAACPKGYTCIAGQCSLNSSSTLQVTLSFDNIEDFDLHLMEPLTDGGYCEIYYGNPGNNPDAGDICQFAPMFCRDGGFGFPIGGGGNPCPAGWLDRDTNAACGGNGGEGGTNPDGVNVENILFANNAPAPSGTYYVRVDYWENCDSDVCSSGMDQNACGGYPTSNIGVQVRLPDSAIYQYCPVISQSGEGPNDHSDAHGGPFPDGAGAGSGFLVTSFTIP